MATEEESRAAQAAQQNPFMRSFTDYMRSLPARLITAPINAVRLPGRLIGEINGSGDRSVAAEQEQRRLASQVGGQPVEPFSKGRQMANLFSLGLVPNNKSTAMDPSAMNEDQMGRFQQLGPIHQALLTASRPADFARILTSDEYWQDQPQQDEIVDVAPGHAMVNSRTGEQVVAPQYGPKVVPPGNAVYEDGKMGDPNAYEPPSLVESRAAAGRASDAAARLSGQKIDESKANIRKLDAQADKASAEASKIRSAADADPNAQNPLSIKDRSAIQAMEKRVNDQLSKQTSDQSRAVTASRNFWSLYELRGSGSTPPSTVRELESMGFKDVKNADPRAIQDLQLLMFGVRMGDPPGRITDSDVKLYANARRMFDPGIVEAVINKTPLTNAQRNELALSVRKMGDSILQTNDQAVVNARNSALRDRIQGNGVGMNPMNVPDQVVDLREQLYGRDLGDQAAFPLATPETEGLLEQLWNQTYPGRRATAAEAVQWANTHGFRVQEVGEHHQDQSQQDAVPEGPVGEYRGDG